MRALRFDRFGEPDVLTLVDLPEPPADRDTAIVAVKAASINPSDVKNAAGRMTQTTLPRIPGRGCSGVVVVGPAEWVGAEVGVTFIAVWCGIVEAAELRPGETLVVIGLGGVGGAAAQIAKRLGGRVIGIDRQSPPPDAPVHAFVDGIVTPDQGDAVTRIRALTDGAGGAVVFDSARPKPPIVASAKALAAASS